MIIEIVIEITITQLFHNLITYLNDNYIFKNNKVL